MPLRSRQGQQSFLIFSILGFFLATLLRQTLESYMKLLLKLFIKRKHTDLIKISLKVYCKKQNLVEKVDQLLIIHHLLFFFFDFSGLGCSFIVLFWERVSFFLILTSLSFQLSILLSSIFQVTRVESLIFKLSMNLRSWASSQSISLLGLSF